MNDDTLDESDDAGRVAVIGMSGEFPGATDVAQFWRNIAAKVESIGILSDQESRAFGASAEMLRTPGFVRASSRLADVEYFDAAFFGYSPKEAKIVDPQQRLLLMHCHRALENAGYVPGKTNGQIGIYAGVGISTYLLVNLLRNRAELQHVSPMQVMLANDKDYAATRVAYELDLRGPAVSVGSACSTSLVAIHHACRSLIAFECDLALAGAVKIDLRDRAGHVYHPGGIFSSDGHTRTFDAQADGTLFGDGAGIVVLKRYRDALEDRDNILAVVRGSAINNDGATKVGYTAPSVQGQSAVIEMALATAGVSAASIEYVEAHGTATPLGDPVEIAALCRAFASARSRMQSCAIGSVKSNVGHLDVAAGVAGFIKTVCALRQRQLPPTVNYSSPNPEIDFENSPFFVNTELREWPRGEHPRRAGVSSFGVGGTNAHVIVEEAPSRSDGHTTRNTHLLCLSAKSQQALRSICRELAAHLREEQACELADVAYTLGVGRAEHAFRLAFPCASRQHAIAELEAAAERTQDHVARQTTATIFLFPGRDKVRLEDAGALYRQEPAFAAIVNRSASALRAQLGIELVLESGPQRAPMLPIAFTIEYALAQFWMGLGVKPRALVGCGIGEFAAACLAGVFEFDDALRLLGARIARSGAGGANVVGGAELAIKLNPPKLPLASGGADTWITNAQATSTEYWLNVAFVAQGNPALSVLSRFPDALLLDLGLEAAPSDTMDVSAAPLGVQRVHSVSDGGDDSMRGSVLPAVGALWEAQVAIDWTALYREQALRRVALPTYPFAKERFWIDAATETVAEAAVSTAPVRREIRDWFYTPAWRQQPFPVRRKSEGLGPLLIFADSGGIGEALRARSETTVIVVRIGDAYTRTAQGDFSIDPRSADDLTKVFAALDNAGIEFRDCAFLWALDLPPAVASASTFAQFQAHVLEVLLRTQRYLGRRGQCRIIAATRGLDRVLSSDTVRAENSMLQALSVVCNQESPSTRCRVLDLDESDSARCARAIEDELSSEAEDVVVAYRDAQRWTRQYVPYPIDASDEKPLQGGVFVITGGLGNVGYALCSYLARLGNATLVILGRGLPPSREQWSDIVASRPERDADVVKIKRILALESAGATVKVLAVDIADREQVLHAFREINERIGPISGVVHAAGAYAFSALDDVGEREFTASFAAKVHGTLNLAEAIGGAPLDFCVLVSSISSLLGGIGYAAYATANAYLDGFAQLMRASGKRFWRTLNWDAWNFGDDDLSSVGRETMKNAILEQEGADAFARTLRAPDSVGQLVVSTTPLQARIEQWVLPQRSSAGQDSRRHVPVATDEQCAAPENHLQRRLLEIWRGHFDMQSIGIDDDFFTLGGDSLLGMSVVAAIQKELGVSVYVRMLFEAPTIATQAQYLAEKFPELSQSVAAQPRPQRPISEADYLEFKRTVVRDLGVSLPERKIARPIAFILSPPRCGSTLLRVMLAGNRALCCPPELELLNFATLAERDALYTGQLAYRNNGLISALAAAHSCDIEAAKQIARVLVSDNLSIEAVYEHLAQKLGNRVLVDKSPVYSHSLAVLKRAEAMCERALFVDLRRHPCGMIHSYTDARLDLLVDNTTYGPAELAELQWNLASSSIVEFLAGIPRERQISIHFESLLAEPERTMRALCAFLCVEYDEQMLEPYADTAQRMSEPSLMVGDPKFHDHASIDANVAGRWKNYLSVDQLSELTRARARQLGYDC